MMVAFPAGRNSRVTTARNAVAAYAASAGHQKLGSMIAIEAAGCGRPGRRLWDRANNWKNTKKVRYQPRKLLTGTPKYAPPSCQIQLWPIVEATGSNVRSHETMTKLASAGRAKMRSPAGRTPSRIRRATVQDR